MYYIQKEINMESGHWLKLDYPSPCTTQHGHSYKVKVFIAAKDVNPHGMVLDFNIIKECFKKYDHQVLNKIEPFNIVNPTAENIARVFCQVLNEKCELEFNKPVCYRVEIKETDSSLAVFEMEMN